MIVPLCFACSMHHPQQIRSPFVRMGQSYLFVLTVHIAVFGSDSDVTIMQGKKYPSRGNYC